MDARGAADGGAAGADHTPGRGVLHRVGARRRPASRPLGTRGLFGDVVERLETVLSANRELEAYHQGRKTSL